MHGDCAPKFAKQNVLPNSHHLGRNLYLVG